MLSARYVFIVVITEFVRAKSFLHSRTDKFPLLKVIRVFDIH